MTYNPPGSTSSRPQRQSRTGLKSTGTRKASAKSDRTRAREFALQALYQYVVSHNDPEAINLFTRDLSGFHKADSVHYGALFYGCVEHRDALDTLITPALDRTIKELSPIEHICMWIGAYEFQNCPDVPWRVVINECIELAKEFGGTDGHKYVNGVLNQLAPVLRSDEVAADRAAPARPSQRAQASAHAVANATPDDEATVPLAESGETAEPVALTPPVEPQA